MPRLADLMSVAKMKSLLLTVSSFALTTGVVLNAYYQKKQFYPSVVYITKSSPSMAVLYVQAFVFVVIFGKLMRKLFFGQLRAAEMEHLIERSWYAVTETCLAFTVFRDDFSPRFVALFTLLLFLKCFHWLAEDRIDFMERSPVITLLFHFRAVALMVVLTILDNYFVAHAYYSTIIKGASVQLVFGFEYAILMIAVVHSFVKYVLHTIDLQSENPWENKTVYLLYTELVLGFVKVVLYVLFLFIMIKVHTFPLFAIRPMYLTLRAFKKAMNDVVMSRRAIRNMNTLYPDATPEELSSGDNVCIICREEMTTGCKKLPCGHIFHTTCLRSWFQRQQTCPTCRMDILRQQNNANQRPAQNAAGPQQGAAQQGAGPAVQNQPPPAFPGFPFPMWPQEPQQNPQAPPPASQSQPSQATTSSTASAATPPFVPPSPLGSPPGGAGAMPPFMMPPFFMPPMPFSVPPPMPGADFSGLSEDELKAMEGHERQNLEARIQCLRNIHVLLDAAMVQVQQYTAVVQTLGLSGGPGTPSAWGSTAQASSAADTHTTNSVKSPRSSTTSAETMPPSSSSSSKTVNTSQADNITVSSSSSPSTSSQPSKSENLDFSGLEGAVGFTVPKEFQTNEPGTAEDSEEMNEVRRRRLQRFSSQNSGPKEKTDKELDLD